MTSTRSSSTSSAESRQRAEYAGAEAASTAATRRAPVDAHAVALTEHGALPVVGRSHPERRGRGRSAPPARDQPLRACRRGEQRSGTRPVRPLAGWRLHVFLAARSQPSHGSRGFRFHTGGGRDRCEAWRKERTARRSGPGGQRPGHSRPTRDPGAHAALVQAEKPGVRRLRLAADRDVGGPIEPRDLKAVASQPPPSGERRLDARGRGMRVCGQQELERRASRGLPRLGPGHPEGGVGRHRARIRPRHGGLADGGAQQAQRAGGRQPRAGLESLSTE